MWPSINGFSESTFAAPVSLAENALEGAMEGINPFCQEDHKQSKITTREILVAFEPVEGKLRGDCGLVAGELPFSDISRGVGEIDRG